MIFTTAALALLGGCEFALGAVVHKRLSSRGWDPANPHDSKTTKYCSWWFDYDDEASFSCDSLLEDYAITDEDLTRWNPSVKDGCEGFKVGQSYCVEAATEPTEPEEPSPTKADPKPSPTKPSNGIETPELVQPGIVSNCDVFYLVKKNEGCDTVASKNGITVAQLTKWNTGIGSTCTGLWADTYACVSIIGHSPATPTKSSTPTNGIQTPSPIQNGMNKNCEKFHLVKTTTTCTSIEDYYNLPLATFKSWNPAVGSNCQSLLANYWVCVAIKGWTPAKPTPTKATGPTNGITTPTPIQSGTIKTCNKFHMVKKTTTCASIQDYYKITMAQIYEWNPAIGAKCTGLWADYNVCVGVIGQKPSPTQPSNGIKTPEPIQANMIKSCKKFHLVQKTTTCDSIQKYYKITMAQLAKWNPSVGAKCTSLWANYNVCVGV